MNQETVTYLTNIVIGVILAALATFYWRQQKKPAIMLYWVLGAWIMTVADVLFAARPWMAYEPGRFFPTIMVTLGHAVLLLGVQQTAGITKSWRLIVGAVAVHAIGLVVFLAAHQPSNWRMVMNGVIWGSFSLVSGWCLRRASHHFWKSPASPATVFIAHGIFHFTRVTLAIVFESQGWTGAYGWFQMVGDLEVSFFMVALFVGLLIAQLQRRHEELMSAQAEVQTLSGLLPICAWCKKVRDDQGYWEQLEDYFSKRSSLKFTHGMCVDCVGKVQESAEPVTR